MPPTAISVRILLQYILDFNCFILFFASVTFMSSTLICSGSGVVVLVIIHMIIEAEYIIIGRIFIRRVTLSEGQR